MITEMGVEAMNLSLGDTWHWIELLSVSPVLKNYLFSYNMLKVMLNPNKLDKGLKGLHSQVGLFP